MYSVRLPAQPYVLPVSLDSLVQHLRLADSAADLPAAEQAKVSDYAKAAAQLWETATRQAVMQANYAGVVSSWSESVSGLVAPVRAVSRVSYRNSANVVVDLLETDYTLSVLAADTLLFPGWRELPAIYPGAAEPVIIYYSAGAASVDEVPPITQQFIKLMTAHWYENPQAVTVGGNYSQLPLGAQELINREREPLL